MQAIAASARRKRARATTVPQLTRCASVNEHETARHVPYPEFLRHEMASTVHNYLPAGSQARQLADQNKAEQIDWLPYRRRDKPSAIRAADADLCAQYPNMFGNRSTSSREEALRKWFIRLRSTKSRENSWGRACDLPRIKKVGENLSEDDWEFLRKCLLVFKWSDGVNLRQFHGLAHCWDHKDSQGTRQPAQRKLADRLEDIRVRAKALTYGKLDAATMCALVHTALCVA